MIIRSHAKSVPFITKDGSTIRSLLDLSNAPVEMQSLAEAVLVPGASTTRHRHAKTEEFYYVTAGSGWMEIGEEAAQVSVGDAIAIPRGAVHKLTNTGTVDLTILCCCAPPYSHDDTELLESVS